MMTAITGEQVESGTALYSKPFLSVYDFVALGFFSTFVWGCPSRHLLKHYNENVSANHLDIGVGSGYFLDRCRFPSPRPRLVLLDLNRNSLDAAGRRAVRYEPELRLGNALEPFDIGRKHFDSVAIMNLLHCLPGKMADKEVVLRNVHDVLSPGGTVFGSTILGRREQSGRLARLVLKCSNRAGWMHNLDDDYAGLKAGLEKYFREVSIEMIGWQALFRAVE